MIDTVDQTKGFLMEPNRFWSLLARKLAGDASLRDLYKLEKLVFEHPELQFWQRLVGVLWNNRETLKQSPLEKKSFYSFYRRFTHSNTCDLKPKLAKSKIDLAFFVINAKPDSGVFFSNCSVC
jgi:hypothetical protein